MKYFSFNMFVTCLNELLKMGSDKIIHLFCRFSFLLVFITSEKLESEDKIKNFMGSFFYMIKPRTKENVQSQ